MRALRRVALAHHAVRTDRHHFAGIDIAQIIGVDQVKGARPGSTDKGASAVLEIQASHAQRAETVWVARDYAAVLCEEDEGECTSKTYYFLAHRCEWLPSPSAPP